MPITFAAPTLKSSPGRNAEAMSLAIRRATQDDIPAIQAIEQQAPSAAHWPAEEYVHLVVAATVLIAEQKGQLCGFVCAKDVAGEWELENIVVASPFLRQGIADTLMKALFKRARSAGGSKVFIEVRESNRPARNLYEKHGFRQTGRRRHYYQNPNEDAILYTCSLT
jgi:[ribosomal protein S18]-alanine N-acetyltransferase